MKIQYLAVLATALLPGAILAQKPGTAIRSLLVLSNDRKVDAALRNAYVFGMVVEDLESKFPKDRFWFQEWGASGLIAIDRKLPIFSERESNRVLLKSIGSCVDSNFVFKVADVLDDDRESVMRTLDKMFLPTERPVGFDMGNAAFGLEIDLNFSLRSGDGSQKKTIGITPPGLSIRQRDDALKDYLMPQRNAPPKEVAAYWHDLSAKLSDEEQAQFHTFGWAKYYLSDGLSKAADRIGTIQQELREAEIAAARTIIDRKDMSDLVAGLPSGDFSFGDMPEKYRNELLGMAGRSWKAYGFGSSAEAVAFVKNSSSLSATVSIGLFRYFDAYDPATRHGGSGMSYMFYTMAP